MKNEKQLNSAHISQSNKQDDKMMFFNVIGKNSNANKTEADNCFAFIYAFKLEVAHTAHYSMQKKLARLKQVLSAQNYVEDPSVSINTKFFDNVIQSFGKTDRILTRNGKEKQDKKCHAICMRKDVDASFQPELFKELVEQAVYLSNFTLQNDYYSIVFKNKINVSLSNVRVYIFDSGIGFVSVFFKMFSSKSDIEESDIYYIYHGLQKDPRFRSAIKKFVEKQLNDFQKIADCNFLETNRNYQNNEINSFGSSVFFNLCFKTKADVLNSKIPGWILGNLPMFKSGGQQKINEKMSSMIEGNLYGCTVQGCCMLTYVKTDNGKIDKDFEKYLNKNIISFCQYSFLEYIMVLHQTYFLHVFSERLERLNLYTLNSTQMIEIEDCNDDCVYFRSKYMFELAAISQQYQQMYVNFRTSLDILSSDKHITKILDILHKTAERKADRVRSSILAVITISSLANVIINLLKLPETFSWEKVTLIAISVPVALFLLLIAVTPSISRFLTHRTFRRIRAWFKRKKK